ncbi:30S ribosomal protein S15 [Candidatus Karelsulcia muelleri]|uniref:30S ribosomal protein S15 n=1 Tax=Candidatus Karelsulcia muelleri TaxID=336810 RepID=UPI0035C8E525
MYLNFKKKLKIIKNYGSSEYDTGNCIVQIALLTEKINNISKHLKKHKHDFNTERSLLKIVNKRKKILKYIKKNKIKIYKDTLKQFKIRK